LVFVVFDESDHFELKLLVVGRFDYEGIAEFDLALARCAAVVSVDGDLLL
jgi:hypothetical protein